MSVLAMSASSVVESCEIVDSSSSPRRPVAASRRLARAPPAAWMPSSLSIPASSASRSPVRSAVDHLRAGDGAALRGTDLTQLDANTEDLIALRAANGAKTNRLEAALSRLQEVEESTIGQLSVTEDADIAKTLIELNSQSAAYQAALRTGASIMQASLMDFLR